MSKLKRILPWIILITGIAITLWLPISARSRTTRIVDTGETRAVVEQTVAKLQAIQPDSLEDQSLRESLGEAVGTQYVSSLWLFTPDGRIVYQAGSKADPKRFYDWATGEQQVVIEALAEGILSNEQKGAVLAAAALRGVGGGDHNWMWNPAVSPLKSPDGKLVGWLGALYDKSTASSAGPTGKVVFSVLFALLLLTVYWLSLPIWVYLDARERGERAWAWTMFALIGNLAALLAYLLVRSPTTRE